MLTVVQLQQVFGTDNHYIQDEGRGHEIIFVLSLACKYSVENAVWSTSEPYPTKQTDIQTNDANMSNMFSGFSVSCCKVTVSNLNLENKLPIFRLNAPGFNQGKVIYNLLYGNVTERNIT